MARALWIAAAAAGFILAPAFLAEAQPEPAGQPAPEIRAALQAGYLPRGATPNSLDILPPPPAPGSVDQARDDAAARAAQALRGSPRFIQATEDADLRFPKAPGAFSCALGVEISEATTPKLFAMMRRTLADVGLSTYPTKTKYQRVRPFVVTSTPTCTPNDEPLLRRDGSYPSGHSAIGWGWALILTQAAPDRANQLLARGRAFGQSRVVCNVHWLSDTEEGRVIAAATVARLNAEPQFRSDLDAVKTEIASARSAGKTPMRDCAQEASRLAAN